MVRPTVDGWGVYLTDGSELACYRGFGARQLAERFLRRYVRSLSGPGTVAGRSTVGGRSPSWRAQR
jgi:hypothetical protein